MWMWEKKFWKEWVQDAGGDKEFYTYDYSLWIEKILMMCFLLLTHLSLGKFCIYMQPYIQQLFKCNGNSLLEIYPVNTFVKQKTKLSPKHWPLMLLSCIFKRLYIDFA